MDSFDYDMLVIGAGQGGLPAAHMAANLGARVALIERAEVGGNVSQRRVRPHQGHAALGRGDAPGYEPELSSQPSVLGRTRSLWSEGERHYELDGGVQRQLLDAKSRPGVHPEVPQNIDKKPGRTVENLRLAGEPLG